MTHREWAAPKTLFFVPKKEALEIKASDLEKIDLHKQEAFMQYVDYKPALQDSYSHNECGASGH